MRNRLSVKRLVASAIRDIAGVLALFLVAGCSSDRVLAAGRAYTLRVIEGDGQTAPAGSVLPRALVVEVRDAAGAPVKASAVIFRVSSGGVDGTAMLDTLAVSDATGRAEAELRLGASGGSDLGARVSAWQRRIAR